MNITTDAAHFIFREEIDDIFDMSKEEYDHLESVKDKKSTYRHLNS